jgi:hypothetical protein
VRFALVIDGLVVCEYSLRAVGESPPVEQHATKTDWLTPTAQGTIRMTV